MTSGDSVLVQPPLMMKPVGNSGTSWLKVRQARKASPGWLSPVGRKVLAATTRAKRSGCSAATRRPSRPPQSWQTSVMPVQVELVDERVQPVDVALVGVVVAVGRLVGAAEADEVGGDGPVAGRGQHRDHRAGRGTTRTARRAGAARARRRPGPRRGRPCAGDRRRWGRARRRSGVRSRSRAGRRTGRRVCAVVSMGSPLGSGSVWRTSVTLADRTSGRTRLAAAWGMMAPEPSHTKGARSWAGKSSSISICARATPSAWGSPPRSSRCATTTSSTCSRRSRPTTCGPRSTKRSSGAPSRPSPSTKS